MCVLIAWELTSIVDSEVKSPKILQLFMCRADAPATHILNASKHIKHKQTSTKIYLSLGLA
jgi:hypothetical protein